MLFNIILYLIIIILYNIFAARFIDETRSTLLFAKRAKLVKTNAKRNEVIDDASILRNCKKEIEFLKLENDKLKVRKIIVYIMK